MAKHMPQYKVMVDDNFHYMEEDERWDYGTFSTPEKAIATCRRLVDESLAADYKPGMTAAQLFERYTSFGDDPFIVAPAGAARGALFSAHDYARERARALAAKGLAGWFRRSVVKVRMRRSRHR